MCVCPHFKDALQEMLHRLNEPETKEVIEAASELGKRALFPSFLATCMTNHILYQPSLTLAGNDIGKVMELVITKIFEIQGHVMQKFGFIPDDAGLQITHTYVYDQPVY